MKYENGQANVLCTKCDAYLLSYSEQRVDDDILVEFRHTNEQDTRCDGYFRCLTGEFEEHGVEDSGER